MPVKLIPRTSSAHDYPLLIKQLLHAPLRTGPEQEIVYRELFRYSYREFHGRVCRLAQALAALGIAPGDTVAVMDWDSHRYLECFFAVPMSGAVLHTINVRLSREQIAYTIEHAGDDVILVHEDFLPLLAPLRDRLGRVKQLVLLRDAPDAGPVHSPLALSGEYEGLLAGASDGFDFPDFDEQAVATTFYTTGTTGSPKGVCFSHRQLVLHTLGIMSGLCALNTQAPVDSRDVYMPLTPMFHVHAWGYPYLMTLLGCKQVYPGRYEPARLLRLIEREQVTLSHCVPTILQMLLSDPEADEVDLSRWKVNTGGAALPRGLCRRALQRGINVFAGYGLSETCPVLTLANLKPPMLDWTFERQIPVRCRTGLPLPLTQLEVVDDRGQPLPHDGQSSGEIVVRGPWLVQGYFDDPARSEQLWRDGWLHTGDVGWIDPEGYLQITDRMADVIKSGGEWISSLALESIISQHPAVSEVAVIGVPDDKWGERPRAFVVPVVDASDRLDDETLRRFVSRSVTQGRLPGFAIPDAFVIVESLPKTSVGKIDKRALRATATTEAAED